MPAIPPKTDMGPRSSDVGFGSKADIRSVGVKTCRVHSPQPNQMQDNFDVVNYIRQGVIRECVDNVIGKCRAAYRALTKREREVAALVCRGLRNKQIAH